MHPLLITNSLTRKKEPFVPIEGNKVKMYVCGPTVYNLIHIGNARPLVFFDVVRRFLEKLGFDVLHVLNFTDVDDKIIDKSRIEGVSASQISEKYILEYEKDMALFKVKQPHVMPRVSTHIPQIIKTIEILIKKDFAYVVEGEVYYRVRSFKNYGKLSGKILDELEPGARVEVDKKKEFALDFTLWKPRKDESEPAWQSPWGWGRPGWHIECSAMSQCYLGESFDLHGGGMDLIHPHHENEIAQSEAASGKPYVKYWMHNNMLTIDAAKMSKSVGNILLARDLAEAHTAEVVKACLLQAHYRSTLDFSDKVLRDVKVNLSKVYATLARAREAKQKLKSEGSLVREHADLSTFEQSFEQSWAEALKDDFNTPKVFALVYEYCRLVNQWLDNPKSLDEKNSPQHIDFFLLAFSRLSEVLNLFGEDPKTFESELKIRHLKEKHISEEWLLKKIEERQQARAAKNFANADAIRKALLDLEIDLKDSKTGSTWEIKW